MNFKENHYYYLSDSNSIWEYKDEYMYLKYAHGRFGSLWRHHIDDMNEYVLDNLIDLGFHRNIKICVSKYPELLI